MRGRLYLFVNTGSYTKRSILGHVACGGIRPAPSTLNGKLRRTLDIITKTRVYIQASNLRVYSESSRSTHSTLRSMKGFVLLSAFAYVSGITAFPQYVSLAGLSERELTDVLSTLNHVIPPPPPGALNDTSPKLVNDAAHPWKPLRNGDVRGPCPGLNTLASHGVRIVTISRSNRTLN